MRKFIAFIVMIILAPILFPMAAIIDLAIKIARRVQRIWVYGRIRLPRVLFRLTCPKDSEILDWIYWHDRDCPPLQVPWWLSYSLPRRYSHG